MGNYYIGKMAQVAVSDLSETQKDQLVLTYATLLLHDGELEISEDKLNKVIKSTGNSVANGMAGLFAKAIKGQDIAKLLKNVGSGAAAPAGGAAAAGGATAAPKEEEKPKEEEPEEDVDMGDLFGGGDDDY